jgi:hypothetical protein
MAHAKALYFVKGIGTLNVSLQGSEFNLRKVGKTKTCDISHVNLSPDAQV